AVLDGGQNRLSIIHLSDLAKYLASSLDLDDWPEISVLVSDRIIFNQMIDMAEIVCGETKFGVKHGTLGGLQNGHVTIFKQPERTYLDVTDDEMRHLLVGFGMCIIKAVFDLKTYEAANSEFPSIRPIKGKELLERAWA
ncbi:hypothetical protein K469DRAFT_586804, partial [Zopfia rhizophila CBS 207.26]